MTSGGRLFRVFYLATQCVGLLSVLLMLIWIFCFKGGFSWRSNPKTEFNLHPFLMSTGFIYLSANSLMVYRGFRWLKKQYLKAVHVGTHACVLVCVIVALIAAFDMHNLARPPKPNLYTAHSWLGLLTVLLYFLQFASGLLLYVYPGAPFTTRINSISYHIFFGLTVFVLATATAFSGLSEKAVYSLGDKYRDGDLEGVLINLIALLHVIFAIMVIYVVTRTDFQRTPSPDDGVSIKAYPLRLPCSRNC